MMARHASILFNFSNVRLPQAFSTIGRPVELAAFEVDIAKTKTTYSCKFYVYFILLQTLITGELQKMFQQLSQWLY